MAFSGRTPESLIPRSDSRNPATTCKGITKSGRPCRRPIDAKASDDDGVLAVVSVPGGDSDSEDIGAAAYFCWQHKDQAEQLAANKSNGPETQLYPLMERTSIDTLVQRLGVLEVNDTTQAPSRKGKGPRRINRPPTWDRVEGPLISVPSDVMAAQKKRRDGQHTNPSSRRKKPSFWASLCCGAADDDDTGYQSNSTYAAPAPRVSSEVRPAHGRPSSANPRPTSTYQQTPGRKPSSSTGENASDTTKMLRYIPQDVSPQLASTLLAELSKPISPHDDEGYIYIFWLTPEASGPVPSSAASTLLTPPSQPTQARRTSDVMRQYSTKQTSQSRTPSTRQDPGDSNAASRAEEGKSTILLKIGRANNVHRRMNEWTRQCGYSLSLVRFYPHVSSSTPTPSPQVSPAASRRQSAQNVDQSRRASDAGTVRKVPTVMRVERMIHLELAQQRVMKKCEACGKQHQEWFEVEATRDGIKKIDQVIKRWVEWAERANEDRTASSH
ncbi:meiotically up-regulated gene 113-domain-containing protein [Boeremia exigua]|uniref:meiotically up-regulated gene 113-domain-containing protein n=1 Tax=Boeremia exigua TaxID=749465 RepID=UPI001E8EEAB3|nr:meiotically up-regulated gene 113-domain-containing protein [Boeremia exigua]KAH6622139.1 meiotically up-regulated gene 113-domain-containing protein [Boeremia exigua]